MIEKLYAFWILGAVFALLIPILAWLYVQDPRLVDGINVWSKPVRFSASLSLFVITLAIVGRWISPEFWSQSWVANYVWLVILAIIIEMVWLIYAANSGVRSHFNFDGGFLTAIYPVMGLVAVSLTSASLVFGLAIWSHAHGTLNPALRDAIALGFILTFFLTVMTAGALAVTGGALGGTVHGPTDTIIGWRQTGADLRLAHFISTHAMQIIPAIALGLVLVLPIPMARALVWLTAGGYIAITAYLFVGALRGQSVPELLKLGS